MKKNELQAIAEAIHSTQQYENTRVEQSHEATRVRERGMRRFKSTRQAQRFVTAHAAVHNLFNLGRHHVRAQQYRDLRVSAFGEWSSCLRIKFRLLQSEKINLPIPLPHIPPPIL